MRIAFVSQPIDPVLPWHRNSMGIWIHEVARRLAQTSEVSIYTRATAGKRLELLEGVTYRRVVLLEDFRKIYRVLKWLKLVGGRQNPKRPRFASVLYYLDYALQISRDLRKHDCDVVHILNFSQFVPVIRALNPKVRIILHMQCEWLTQLDRKMMASRLKQVDLMVGCSEYITDLVRRAFPKFRERCTTIHNGVDVSRFTFDAAVAEERKNGSKRVLFVGRVSPEKGLHVLLDAMRDVVDRYPDTQLYIVGPQGQIPLGFIVGISEDELVSGLSRFYDGRGYQRHLEEQLKCIGMNDRVTFTGSLPHGRVVDHYRNADVLVNPSFSESFGMSLVEAMSCKIPVVGTRVGGMTEVLRDMEQVGILVQPGDPKELASAIIRVLSNDSLRKSMGNEGRERAVNEFGWDQIARKTLVNYTRICNGQKVHSLGQASLVASKQRNGAALQ